MAPRTRPQLTLLVPPPFHQYAPRSPTYFAATTTPSPVTSSATTLTPAGTIIFDSSNIYTPTSPAKPFIYSTYLPPDESTLSQFLKAERDARFRKHRSRVLVALYWLVGVSVIAAFWGWSSWCSAYSYRNTDVFNRLFTGLIKQHRYPIVEEMFIHPPEVKLNENGTRYGIFMPNDEKNYPLPGAMYAELCTAVGRSSMMSYKKREGKDMAAHLGYDAVDVGYDGLHVEGSVRVEGECEKTLTYVVDDLSGRVGGVGEVVLGMWMAYGVAKKEGREFFVVQRDGRWSYGDIHRYFNIPAPSNNCVPPPMSRRIPCPQNTEHRLITPATFHQAFGHSFENDLEDARSVGVNRQKPIFDLLRAGYDAIPLSSSISNAVSKRIQDIGVSKKRAVVAVQIRRGDKKAREWNYHNGYIPVERYLKVSANETADVSTDLLTTSDVGDKWVKEYSLPDYPKVECADFKPLRIISSDASDIFENQEIKDCVEFDGSCVRAQDRKVNVGAPGGFWAEDLKKMDREVKEAEGVAVGYLTDFGVLVGSMENALDGWVVCGHYGDMCRMLAVGMGWDSAIEKGHWVNIDGDFDWFGMRW
ncbi:hypothetical protein TWF694_002943 [Orbilia ellipsospora]|uniref:Uncharacterized protein n=1 Tax=Orbilia ellipsospora TaxID=2528407 RepID=A0AAV9X115_9PEZI